MAIGTGAALIGSALIGAAGSAAASAFGPGAPNAPDYAAANKAGIEADIATLARRRLIDSSAGLGKELLREGFQRTYGGDVPALTAAQQAKVQQLQAREAQLAQQLVKARAIRGDGLSARQAREQAIAAAQAQMDGVRDELRAANAALISIQQNQGAPIYTDKDGNVVTRAEALEADFTGLGDADKAGVNADKLAQTMLDLQRKYGSDFVAEARKQLEQSDPEGWAARKRLFDEVMADQDRQPDLTLSKTIQQQMLDELNQGGATDAATNREIEQFLTAQQSARGGGYGKADEYERAMGVGQAAEARKAQRKQQALAFLTSGATPDDVSFRRGQQNKANLASFLSGTTPTAQFASLSGAQNQAAPFIPGTPGPTLNPNAGAQGAAYAQGNYNTQTNYAAGQANPWMAGLGLGLKAYGTFNQGNPWGNTGRVNPATDNSWAMDF